MLSIHSLLLHPNLSPPAPSSSLFFLSGRAHGALDEALVDGDGHYSSRNGGLCLSCLPPLSHHHLLQGHQEVGRQFSVRVHSYESMKYFKVTTN